MNDSEKFKNKYRIKSNRLQGYDYASQGAYFVTICTKDKRHLFGEVVNEKMILNEFGKVAFNEWQRTSEVRKNVTIDKFVIMPNHVHGIIFIDYQVEKSPKVNVQTNCNVAKTNCNLSLPRQNGTSQTIGSIIRGFKIGVTKYVRNNSNIQDVWQANYYDRIVRNDVELNNFGEYIMNNPRDWEKDEFY